jgi:hypothetical protein
MLAALLHASIVFLGDICQLIFTLHAPEKRLSAYSFAPLPSSDDPRDAAAFQQNCSSSCSPLYELFFAKWSIFLHQIYSHPSLINIILHGIDRTPIA